MTSYLEKKTSVDTPIVKRLEILKTSKPKHSFFSFGFGFEAFVLTAIQNLLARK
jgi:hypothetical protein